MALKGPCIGLMAALTAAVLWKGASAQSSTCTSAIVSLSPCLTYITGNATTPSSSCCQQLATVVQSQPQCLCMVLNGSASSIGIAVNQTQAMALPGACNVQTPPASRCNTSAGPTGSPTARPPDSPSVPGTPSGAGSITLPTGISYGMATQLPLTLTFFLVFVAVYLSSPTTTI